MFRQFLGGFWPDENHAKSSPNTSILPAGGHAGWELDDDPAMDWMAFFNLFGLSAESQFSTAEKHFKQLQ